MPGEFNLTVDWRAKEIIIKNGEEYFQNIPESETIKVVAKSILKNIPDLPLEDVAELSDPSFKMVLVIFMLVANILKSFEAVRIVTLSAHGTGSSTGNAEVTLVQPAEH